MPCSRSSSATPPTASSTCATTWTASSSCSAAAATSNGALTHRENRGPRSLTGAQTHHQMVLILTDEATRPRYPAELVERIVAASYGPEGRPLAELATLTT